MALFTASGQLQLQLLSQLQGYFYHEAHVHPSFAVVTVTSNEKGSLLFFGGEKWSVISLEVDSYLGIRAPIQQRPVVLCASPRVLILSRCRSQS